MNQKGKIAFVVGHSNWGKSTTLRELTNGRFSARWHSISGVDFFVRRMSNDDIFASYMKFMNRITPAKYDHMIASLCPTFNLPKNPAEDLLISLRKKGFILFFWVLENEQGPGTRTISKAEIRTMEKLGEVEIHREKSTPKQNARLFSKFVAGRVLA